MIGPAARVWSVAGDWVPQNGQINACLPGFQLASAPQAGQWNLSRAVATPSGSGAWRGSSITRLLQELGELGSGEPPL